MGAIPLSVSMGRVKINPAEFILNLDDRTALYSDNQDEVQTVLRKVDNLMIKAETLVAELDFITSMSWTEIRDKKIAIGTRVMALLDLVPEQKDTGVQEGIKRWKAIANGWKKSVV